MGDRAIIVVTDGPEIGCAVYTHWGGEDAANLLKAAIPTMRSGDVSYSIARLAASLCANVPDTNLGVGVYPPPSSLDADVLEREYDLNAGALIYDCGTGETQWSGGYEGAKGVDPYYLPIPPG